MPLRPEIRDYILARCESIPFAELKAACAALSAHYRSGQPSSTAGLPPQARTAAYLLTRFPATYSAAEAVMRQLRRGLPEQDLTSCLDLGAGAGSATLAARSVFPSLAEFSLIDSSPEMREAARELIPEACFPAADLRSHASYPEHDLVVAAYVLGELAAGERAAVLARAWRSARRALALIEPGSPDGFALIREARTWLLESGAQMLAPCPGGGPCPMEAPDWCHFAARLERTSLHRRMKDAALGYEDEKFSYVVFSRRETPCAAARIIRRPEHSPGVVRIVTCSGGRIERRLISRRSPAFRAARQARWGDPWTGPDES